MGEAALSPPLHRARRPANLPCDAVVFCPHLFLAVSDSYLTVGGFPFALSIAQRQQYLSAKELDRRDDAGDAGKRPRTISMHEIAKGSYCSVKQEIR